ncbi:hypothetical protein H5410_022018 [Solanum commersonii]|uniref:Uncharacterized protein n=1 Tax=Solanum commersonii TaxID=4109 RepID=A0A9J5ZCZ8_SOLCO|nr:hypothetical protein H5410_022018 [Solanum commersonii]
MRVSIHATDKFSFKWGKFDLSHSNFLCDQMAKEKIEMVGDPLNDHECWTRPVNMKASRNMLMIDNRLLNKAK